MDSKYKNGKIYKITDIGYNKCYIGSTTEQLSQRMTRHRSEYRLQKPNHKTSVFQLFDEFGVDNCKIELIEYYECNTRAELLRKEGEHIQNTNCVNRVIAGRTKQEYRNTHKDEKCETDKIYRENNKEAMKEKKRIYYEKNKELFKQKSADRYAQKKDQINAKLKEKRNQKQER